LIAQLLLHDGAQPTDTAKAILLTKESIDGGIRKGALTQEQDAKLLFVRS
jgi:hypothetical protein